MSASSYFYNYDSNWKPKDNTYYINIIRLKMIWVPKVHIKLYIIDMLYSSEH